MKLSSHGDINEITDDAISGLIDELFIDMDADLSQPETPPTCIPSIASRFSFVQQLGRGASCRVLQASDKTTSQQYALKEMAKSDPANMNLFWTEHHLLKLLSSSKSGGHPNIIGYHGSFSTKQHYAISTTYCSGGTMLERIIKTSNFSEAQCTVFIKNVLHGLQYMHSLNVVHRDIKCQNLVFDRPGDDGIVKIIDFGNSEIIDDPQQRDAKFCGTLHYLPPELLSSKPRTKGMLFKGITLLLN